MRLGSLSGQVAVITGAGRGLGRAVALGFAREGANLWICARTRPELEKTGQLIGADKANAEVRVVDLAQSDACRAFAAEVLERAGRVDVLVNNAGILRLAPIEEITASEWSQVLAANLTAPFLLTQHFLPGMRAGGGSVINVSSRAGIMPFTNECAYCASKFGLEGMTRSLALELTGTRISINTVTPGLRIKPTSLTESALERVPAAERDQWEDPEKLVPAFTYLAALRGQVTGLRFDAFKLSQLVACEGYGMTPDQARSASE
jgi:NAD(P)-dependent dehydrogenase (short-subunit alcohol dehydrogenase family)